MKPRVLQLIGSFHNGGSERQAVALTRLLKEEGSFDVSVAVLNGEGVLRDEVMALALGKIAEFPITSFFRPSFIRQARAFADHLRAEKIDVIHTHDFYTNVFGMTAAALAGTYGRVASKRETDGMRTKNQDRVERLAFGAASKIVANSKAVSDHLVARGIKEGRVELIYNGVDLNAFRSVDPGDRVRQAYDLPTDTRLVTLVANLRHPVKNVPMFLRAADQVSRKLPDVTFVVAGEGKLKTDLEAMSSQLSIKGLTYFIGRCDDVPALLAASSVCVLTSEAEGFSNSVLEYMAAGKPVIATDVGGAAEVIVDGETGYLVSSRDDATMAERLVELLRDGEKAAAFGKAARERVAADFSPERQLKNTLDLYHRLLAK